MKEDNPNPNFYFSSIKNKKIKAKVLLIFVVKSKINYYDREY